MGTDIFRNPLVRKVFMVSGGRTATTLFGGRFSSAFDDVFSVHEPDRVDLTTKALLPSLATIANQGILRMGILKSLGRAGTRNLSLSRSRGDIDRQEALRWFTADRSHLGAIDKPIYVEANYQLFGVLEDCLTFPNSHAVVILRDPVTWIQSWLRKKWYASNDLLTRLDVLGFKRISPENVGEINPDWAGYDRTEKLAWVWGYLTQKLTHLEESCPQQVSVFRFEDLVGGQQQSQNEQQRLLALVFGESESAQRLPAYSEMIRSKDNAAQGRRTDVVLPKWFLDEHGALLSRYDYV